MATNSGLDRLGRAMALWLEHRADPDASAAAFLARHEDLRDLLEPLLADAPEEHDGALGPGAQVGDFRLVRELGRGGMGVVFEAVQLSLDRTVALKVLLPGAALQPRALARFRREASTAARFEHPGIVTVHAVGEHRGAPWLAMEHIDGDRLDLHVATLRRDRPDDWLAGAVRLVADVADALECAHRLGVVHRDIKPSNVLVRRDGTPTITDFGLARSSGLPSLSQTGEFAGTPNYVSPEQARGAAEVDARSDVFSLGVTLFELATGQLPFPGATTRAVLDGIQRAEPRPPSRLAPELPAALDAVVLRALAKDPARRYQSAAEFAVDLRRFLAHRPVLARLPGVRERAVRWLRREPLRAALGAAVLVAAAMAIYLLDNGSALRRGNRDLDADRVEDLLLRATMGELVGMPRAEKQQLIAEAIELAGDDPYAVVVAAQAEGQAGKAAPALARLDAFAAHAKPTAAVLRLRRQLTERIAAPATFATAPPSPGAPPPEDALDHYVAGSLALARAVRGDAAAGGEALAHMRRAVALSTRPRAMFLIGCNQAGRVVGDLDAVREACDALAHHWPRSAASRCFRAMAWIDRDPEVARAEAQRSLELAPDNFLGLTLLADVLRLDGDAAGADELQQRATRLHPGPARFLGSGAHEPIDASTTKGR